MSNNDMRVIKGDTFNLKLRFRNNAGVAIEKIYFSSRNILTREFIYEPPVGELEGFYRLTVLPSETSNWAAGKTSYDITIYFSNDSVHTAQHKGSLIILPKDNKINLEVDENG